MTSKGQHDHTKSKFIVVKIKKQTKGTEGQPAHAQVSIKALC